MVPELYRISISEGKGRAVLEILAEDLDLGNRDEFLEGCRRLLEAGQPHLIIDMHGLQRLFSIFIGTVMDVNVKARLEGRRLTVVASDGVTRLFRTVVGPESLEVCPPPGPMGEKGSRRSAR